MPGCTSSASRGLPALLAWRAARICAFINTPGAVLVGIVYGYLPLMILPIYVSLERLDRRLLEASADLGATAGVDLPAVTLPLSLPGVMTGCSLVTILLLGEYLIPSMLGGGKVFFIGNALVDLFLQSRNWPFGSAVAVDAGGHHADRRRRQPGGARREGSAARRGAGVDAHALLHRLVFSFSICRSSSSCCSPSMPGAMRARSPAFRSQWYGQALSNTFLVEALTNSVIVASRAPMLAAVIGTAAALGLERVRAGDASWPST